MAGSCKWGATLCCWVKTLSFSVLSTAVFNHFCFLRRCDGGEYEEKQQRAFGLELVVLFVFVCPLIHWGNAFVWAANWQSACHITIQMVTVKLLCWGHGLSQWRRERYYVTLLKIIYCVFVGHEEHNSTHRHTPHDISSICVFNPFQCSTDVQQILNEAFFCNNASVSPDAGAKEERANWDTWETVKMRLNKCESKHESQSACGLAVNMYLIPITQPLLSVAAKLSGAGIHYRCICHGISYKCQLGWTHTFLSSLLWWWWWCFTIQQLCLFRKMSVLYGND